MRTHNSPFFHFSHRSGPLRRVTLVRCTIGPGGRPLSLTTMQTNYRYTRTAVITTGMAAGSLEVFATYLHSLADAYSHQDCIAAMDALGMPWATHTITQFGDPSVPACNYNPLNFERSVLCFRAQLDYDQPASRRAYADLIARSALMQRNRVYLPVVIKSSP